MPFSVFFCVNESRPAGGVAVTEAPVSQPRSARHGCAAASRGSQPTQTCSAASGGRSASRDAFPCASWLRDRAGAGSARSRGSRGRAQGRARGRVTCLGREVRVLLHQLFCRNAQARATQAGPTQNRARSGERPADAAAARLPASVLACVAPRHGGGASGAKRARARARGAGHAERASRTLLLLGEAGRRDSVGRNTRRRLHSRACAPIQSVRRAHARASRARARRRRERQRCALRGARRAPRAARVRHAAAHLRRAWRRLCRARVLFVRVLDVVPLGVVDALAWRHRAALACLQKFHARRAIHELLFFAL